MLLLLWGFQSSVVGAFLGRLLVLLVRSRVRFLVWG